MAYGEANEYTLHTTYTERFISGKRFRGTETIWVVKKLSNERKRWNSNVDWRNVKKMNFTVYKMKKRKKAKLYFYFYFFFLGGGLFVAAGHALLLFLRNHKSEPKIGRYATCPGSLLSLALCSRLARCAFVSTMKYRRRCQENKSRDNTFSLSLSLSCLSLFDSWYSFIG